MKLMQLTLMLAFACMLTCGCAGQQTQSTTVQEEAVTVETEQEESGTVREYATVEEITEDYFVVKTTKDETYWIDGAFNDGFEVGGLVLVIYEADGKVAEDDHFKVSPTSVFHSSTEIVPSDQDN